MLEGLLRADFTITGTWPMRSERSARSVALGTVIAVTTGRFSYLKPEATYPGDLADESA